MATYFDTDNIPDEFFTPALGAQHFESALTVIQDALTKGEVAAYEANAAYVSERNDWMETSPIVAPRGGVQDDVLVQITVRIPRTEQFKKFESEILEEDKLRTQERAEAELARIEQEEAALARRRAAALDALAF
jgi:hypothetical protein